MKARHAFREQVKEMLYLMLSASMRTVFFFVVREECDLVCEQFSLFRVVIMEGSRPSFDHS